MIVKTSDLITSFEAIAKIASLRIGALNAFYLKRILPIVETAIQDYDKARTLIFEQYGHRNEQGNWIIEPSTIMAFNDELLSLNNAEIEIPLSHKLRITVNEDLTALDLHKTDYLIEWELPKTETGETNND